VLQLAGYCLESKHFNPTVLFSLTLSVQSVVSLVQATQPNDLLLNATLFVELQRGLLRRGLSNLADSLGLLPLPLNSIASNGTEDPSNSLETERPIFSALVKRPLHEISENNTMAKDSRRNESEQSESMLWL